MLTKKRTCDRVNKSLESDTQTSKNALKKLEKSENIPEDMVKDNQDKKENYVAYWKDNTAFYEISGKMEKEEFLKMIKNIRF